MESCIQFRKEMLIDPIEVTSDGELDFVAAKLIADQKAKEVSENAMLLSWYDAQRGVFSPNVT